ncbi:hypothetical protein DRP53_06925 [candidate division WOR-3 bacterium]|uniref:T9SS type A sorting domain-containing protein n=1 Tax=candidate division WOR-3 bacterium TaxID=2052148 RepID=A0A660SGD3_UNCW3|nr:MAG: hypothetical protein DRP53_06925 [candidate division WOR-3 bacterium]
MRKVSIFLILVLPIWAGTITKEFLFSPTDLILTPMHGYTLIEMKGADILASEGKPILPYFIEHIVIPPTAEVTGVEVVAEGVEYLPEKITAYPAQKPRPFSYRGEPPFTPPDPKIYYSSEPYPGITHKYYPTGSKHGWRICAVDLFPIQYLPDQNRLKFISRMKVTIHYREGVHQVSTITQRQYDVFHRAVKNLVANPEDVEQFRPNLRADGINDVNYAIITSSQYVDKWGSLVEWKTKKGWMAKTFSTTWIYSNYNGRDNQEKIRYFLRDYYQNKGLIWAVLGGDWNIVPERDIYSSYYQPYYIACDWYYCDLDSNWNRNGNTRYGEIGDVIPPDCYFEVYCARAPIDNTTDINRVMDKILTFEKNPNPSTIQRTVLPSVMLFSGYHGRIVNNAIASLFPAGWTHYKLEDQAAPATRNSINSNNPEFVHIAAHGDRNGTYFQYGARVFTESDIPYLSNTLPFICNSIACYSGEFDNSYDDCFAEELIVGANSPKGAVCTIFNSRYGFGTPPSMGPSEQMDTLFYHAICKLETLWFGVAHAISKEHFRNPIWSQGLWHYCGTELNPFGDPELNMYLYNPTKLHISFPEPIPPGNQNFTVTVTDSKAPVEDALVCCYQPGQIHVTGRTDASGQVTLSINPIEGDMFVTASAFNYLPVEDTCTVQVGVAEGKGPIINRIWTDATVVTKQIRINYRVARKTELSAHLYNSIGSRVAILYDGMVEGEGAISKNVEALPAGIYYIHFQAPENRMVRVVIIH